MGSVPWERLRFASPADQSPWMTIRGKNLLFLRAIFAALQLDDPSQSLDWGDIKSRLTPTVVRFIHEALLDVWPSGDDLSRTLALEKARGGSSAVYVGNYFAPEIIGAVSRNSLYNDRLLVLDPLIYPSSVREEFSPLLQPERHLLTTMAGIHIWLQLFPWIDAGIVGIIRSPGDFDTALNLDCMREQRELFHSDSELMTMLERASSDSTSAFTREMQEWLLLETPDEQVMASYRDVFPGADEEEVKSFLADINERRRSHPFFIKHGYSRSDIVRTTTGVTYGMARRIARACGGLVVSDTEVLWRVMQKDRRVDEIDPRGWMPFAKAFHAVDLKYVRASGIDLALELRKTDLLAGMRAFFRKLWLSVRDTDHWSEERAADLACELDAEVRTAQGEWNRIDRDLVTWTGGTLSAAVAAGVVIGGGSISLLAPIIAGVTNIATGTMRRRALLREHPAAMFLDRNLI